MPTARSHAPRARLIASLDAWNAKDDKVTICVTSGPGGYRVWIDGGLLGDGEDEAVYDSLGRALDRMSQEAGAAITGDYL